MEQKKEIAYVYSSELISASDQIFKQRVTGRALVVHSLIDAYNLTEHLDVIPPKQATLKDLLSFHSEPYIKFLKETKSTDLKRDECEDEFGLGYDCPVVPNLYSNTLRLTGGTLTAVQSLKSHDVAINWCGGWHHAKRDEASGFCYVNDIVIAILQLLNLYDRVLYIDLDVHHGDGVEEAFVHSKRVFCLSLHKYEAGFFPGTGSCNDIGLGKGHGYTANVPLKDGTTDCEYTFVFTSVLNLIVKRFQPTCVVCQCGADTLNEDPLGTFNLTLQGLGECIKRVTELRLPTLYLGGGGYKLANVARCWTYLTSLIAGVKIEEDIPDHEFYLLYGPAYDLSIPKGNRSSQNKLSELDEIVKVVKKNLKKLQ